MSWYYDLKISAKLLTAFILSSVLTAVVGGIGIHNMSQINKKAEDLYSKETMGISWIKEADIDLGYVQRYQKNVLISSSQAERTLYATKVNEYTQQVDEDIAKAKGLIHTDKGKEVLSKFDGAWTDFQRMNQNIMAIAMKEPIPQKRESVTLSTGAGREKAAVVSDLLTQLITMKEDLAKDASADISAIYLKSRLYMILLVIGSTLFGMCLGLFISRLIGNPMRQLDDVANKLAVGDMIVTVESIRKDEIGSVMRAMSKMVQNLTRFAMDVQGAAALVASGSEQVNATAQSLSQGATEQASSVEEISSSMEEMNSTVKQNSDSAQQTTSIASKSASSAEDGGKAVAATVDAMKSIAEKIGIIEEIARQTNMLALNAAIEAARAGEHGKGFAVVAAEVRKLAERSQSAAKEISEVSTSSVEVAEQAGEILKEMVPSIQKTAELVEEINASSAEQSTGIDQVTKAINQLDQVIQGNSSATEEMSAASEELAEQAEQLLRTAAFFKLKDEQRQNAGIMNTCIPVSSRARNLSKSSGKPMSSSKPKSINLSLDGANDIIDKEFERAA